MIILSLVLFAKKNGHSFKGCKVLNDHEFLKLAFIKTCLYFSSLHWAQAEIQVHELCAHLNMDTPDDDTYVQIWEISQKVFESQDFHKAKEDW